MPADLLSEVCEEVKASGDHHDQEAASSGHGDAGGGEKHTFSGPDVSPDRDERGVSPPDGTGQDQEASVHRSIEGGSAESDPLVTEYLFPKIQVRTAGIWGGGGTQRKPHVRLDIASRSAIFTRTSCSSSVEKV